MQLCIASKDNFEGVSLISVFLLKLGNKGSLCPVYEKEE